MLTYVIERNPECVCHTFTIGRIRFQAVADVALFNLLIDGRPKKKAAY